MKLKTAKNLVQGDYIHHKTLKNADGTPMRARVLSIKTWKRESNTHRVVVSVKHGMYDYFKFDENNINEIEKGYGS